MADVEEHPTCPFESTFSATTLDINQSETKKKQPKRVLHFSDGVLEEYSSDDSEDDASPIETKVDPSMLAWTPWFVYYVTLVAKKSFTVAELCGEKLAWFFGITTPKYAYAIEEYKRMAKEIELERERDQKLYEESQGLSAVDVRVVDKKTPVTSQLSGGNSEFKNATEKY